jgi:CRP/FNR family transcriptional regulator
MGRDTSVVSTHDAHDGVQMRAIVSSDARIDTASDIVRFRLRPEKTRLFDYDTSLLSASCVMPDMQFNVMIEAEKDSEFWSIPACLFKNLVDESLAVSNYSRSLLSSNFSELMWLMEQIMWKSFDKRLADFLLEESAIEGSPVLKITHEKIANHLGTAREVVTRMLRYFQGEGMVKLTRGAIEITDQEKLEALQNP